MTPAQTKYMVDQLLRLLQTPSPTGHADRAVRLVEDEFRRLGLATRRTRKGALVATWPGEDAVRQRALTAHVDTLGAMVREVLDSGRLKLRPIGGLSAHAAEGEYCQVETADRRLVSGTILPVRSSLHVFGKEYEKLDRTWDNMAVRLDERVSSRQEAEALGIAPGDYVFLDPRPQLTSAGYVKSRFLDDKASVAAILGAVRALVDADRAPRATTHFLISVWEETGHGAPAGLPEEVVELVAVDMAAVGPGQASDESAVTVCAMDSSGPYDLGLRQRLVELGRKAGLDVRIDLYPHYASDASAAVRAGRDVAHGLIGPGVESSHTHERLHVDALVATARLIAEYLTH